jgi:predicted transposase YbfD/YdcC
VKTTTTTERRTEITHETSYFISSADLTPARAADAIRAHWGIESYHWVLDVVFKEDLSRLRRGHGARNMALVRRFAFNMVRHRKGKRSIAQSRQPEGRRLELRHPLQHRHTSPSPLTWTRCRGSGM